MPVRKLLVEGDLDQELLSAFTIIMGGTLIEALKESKYALLPSTRAERRKLKAPVTFYLRDRDFDHEPGLPEHKPTVDKTDKEDGDAILGWRWYRHEIENYLLEPAVVHAATGINVSAFTNALKTAAREIRFYQAARWTIGLSRSHLPRDYELQTRPNKIHGLEFILPEDLSENSMWQWVEESSESFLHVA